MKEIRCRILKALSECLMSLEVPGCVQQLRNFISWLNQLPFSNRERSCDVKRLSLETELSQDRRSKYVV